jgi:hypothetical protein
MDDYINTDVGHWTEAATRLLPRGEGYWIGIKGRAHTFLINRKPVATARCMRQRPIIWSARIEGFEWKITDDMPAARFRRVPGGRTVTHSPVKGFPTLAQAKKAIESVVTTMPKSASIA